jgi:ribonuclease HI
MENASKIKCDGAFVKETRKGGWGCVIMDHQSVFVAGSAGNLGHVSSTLQAEAAACMKGLELAAQLGLQYVILETDAANLVQGLTGYSLIDQRSVLCSAKSGRKCILTLLAVGSLSVPDLVILLLIV